MQEPFDDSTLTMSVDGDKIVVDVTLREPVDLPWGAQLRGYSLVVGRGGILMGRLELSEFDPLLSVSPESLVLPG